MEEIIKKCKCGVFLTANEHRDYYQTVKEAIDEINERDKNANGHHDDYQPEIDEELANKMIDTGTIIELQFYPDTPIGSYKVYGTSVEDVVEQALEILK